jgi:predicted sugar kinase
VFEQPADPAVQTRHVEGLCRLTLLGLLPALAGRNLPAFGEALEEFNRRAGEPFAASQGGEYAGPAVAEAVAFLRRQGVRAVGQSSWGPTVFGVTDGTTKAEEVARAARAVFRNPSAVWVAAAWTGRG